MSGTNKELLFWRKLLLDEQGGISQPIVNNAERLYLFEEETRNSIMIEGYFPDKKTLKDVIQNNNTTYKDADKILGYYDAAQLMYEYAYQKHISQEDFSLAGYDIKTAHSLLMKMTNPGIGGKRRAGDMMISGAELQPVYGALVGDMMKYYVDHLSNIYKKLDLVPFLAQSHCLFESIHPFEDGNGRVGRILLNYMLVMHGYPNIIIKGNKFGRDRYIDSLIQAEQGLIDSFPAHLPKKDRAVNGDFGPLEGIIYEGLFRSIDYMLLVNEDAKSLIPIVEIVEGKGYTDEYARKLVARGKVIAKKIGNTRYSHERYFRKPLKKKSDI